jgi:hypothetical protein
MNPKFGYVGSPRAHHKGLDVDRCLSPQDGGSGERASRVSCPASRRAEWPGETALTACETQTLPGPRVLLDLER